MTVRVGITSDGKIGFRNAQNKNWKKRKIEWGILELGPDDGKMADYVRQILWKLEIRSKVNILTWENE